MELKDAVRKMFGLKKQYPNYIIDVDKYLSTESLNESSNPYEEVLFYVSRETGTDPLTLNSLSEAQVMKIIDFDDIVNVTEQYAEAKNAYQKSVNQQLKTLGKEKKQTKKEDKYELTKSNVKFLNELSKKTLFKLIGDIDAYKTAKAQIKIIREHKKYYPNNPKFDEDLKNLEEVIELFENALKNPVKEGKEKKETEEFKEKKRELKNSVNTIRNELKGYSPSSIIKLYNALKPEMPIYDEDYVSEFPEMYGKFYDVYDPSIENGKDKFVNLLYFISSITGLDVFEIYFASESKIKKALRENNFKLVDRKEELKKEEKLVKLESDVLSSSAYGTTASDVALEHYSGDKRKAVSLIMASYAQVVIATAINVANSTGAKNYIDDLVQEGMLFSNIKAEEFVETFKENKPSERVVFYAKGLGLYLKKYAAGLKKGGIMGGSTAINMATEESAEYREFKNATMRRDPSSKVWSEEEWKIAFSMERIKEGKETLFRGNATIKSIDEEDDDNKKIMDLKSDYSVETEYENSRAKNALEDACRDYIDIVNAKTPTGLRIFAAGDVLVLDRIMGFVENKYNPQSKWFWTQQEIAKDIDISAQTVNVKFTSVGSNIFKKLKDAGATKSSLRKSCEILTNYIKYLYSKENKQLRGVFYLIPQIEDLITEEVKNFEKNIVKGQDGKYYFEDEMLRRLQRQDYIHTYKYTNFVTKETTIYNRDEQQEQQSINLFG